MECPHFAGVLMKYCAAEKAVYVPSIYEMREYCRHQQHRLCPFYSRTENTTRRDDQCSAESDSMASRQRL